MSISRDTGGRLALDVLVIDQLATVSGGNSLLNFSHEPLVEVHHAFYCVNYKLFGVPALLGSQLSQFRLQIGIQADFHRLRLRFARSAVNHRKLPYSGSYGQQRNTDPTNGL
jgi:hypothetical protein